MSNISSEKPSGFDSWAVVELMGHQRAAGKVTEQNIAGANMLRIDIPQVVKKDRDWNNGGGITEKTIPAYTRYFSASAIYSITPCSEEIARAAAASHISEPPVELALPTKALPAAESASGGDDDSDGLCAICDAAPCRCPRGDV